MPSSETAPNQKKRSFETAEVSLEPFGFPSGLGLSKLTISPSTPYWLQPLRSIGQEPMTSVPLVR